MKTKGVRYRQITDGSFGENGLDQNYFRGLLDECESALEFLRTGLEGGALPFLKFAGADATLAELEPIAARYTENYDDVVILGTGGSSLGGHTLCAIAPPVIRQSDGTLGRPNLHFMDGVDPDGFDRLFSAIDPARTGFIAISKSGETAETISQFLASLDAINDGEHFTIITEPGDRPLRALAEEHGIPVLDHNPAIPGRFSALSLVGLLPALIAGLDAQTVLEGAEETLQPLFDGTPAGEFAPAVGAALNIGLARKGGINATILMPYAERLAQMGLWYRQLWAESLGKGGHGTTPVRALGPVDQHSQLQLYLGGPKDKFFTLIFAPAKGTGAVMNAELATDPRLSYLAGRRMGDLLDAEQRATAEILIAAGRPTRIIEIDAVDEASLGALLMHFFLETIIAARLLGVNPFDQPAVDEGKAIARRRLEEYGPNGSGTKGNGP
ncbi:MAG: glucose-6-phosphate isomerase [Rhodospirillales bacterium]|nr:glucose-6-phosphate isomerase [Rhodospirillales bacterium]